MKYLPKIKICQAFNAAAATYNLFNSVQEKVGSTLIEMLSHYNTTFNYIIDLGCGTGSTTEKLLSSIDYKSAYAIDQAQQLVALARDRLCNHNINILIEDFEQLPSLPDFDLIFSNMSLQWALNLVDTLNSIIKLLPQQGLFCFTVPLINNFYELNSRRKKYFDLTQYCEILTKLNLKVMDAQEKNYQLYFPTKLTALRYIRALGANYLINNNSSKSDFSIRHNKEPFNLTYHIGYFIAKKYNAT